MDQLCNLNIGFVLVLLLLNSFQLVALLKSDSNCNNSFTLFPVDKISAGTEGFVSVTTNAGTWPSVAAAVKTKFSE